MPFVIKPGVGVLLPFGEHEIPHPWIALSYPVGSHNSQVALVNLTTYRAGADETTIFEPGDHHWVLHKTYVYYGMARLSPAAKFKAAATSGRYGVLDFSDLIDLIWDGIFESDHTPLDVETFCKQNPIK